MLLRYQFYLYLLIIIEYIFGEINCATVKEENTLQQVHVIFRHGDRTPDLISMYPKDPHINDTFQPYGLGALTNLGKQQEYEIGRELRKKYGDFLGDLYKSEIMEAISTSFPRAKLSLQLVLAGLWPPNSAQTFLKNLPWQPIDFTYVPFAEDNLLGFPLFRRCSGYYKDYIKAITSREVENFMNKNEENIKHINKNSGLAVNTLLEMFVLYFGLYAEEHTNRTLPQWTKKVYPTFLESAAMYEYELQTSTNNMFKYTGGPLIQKILNDTKAKINNQLEPSERKIFLYSGHEFNVAHTLRALKAYKSHIPQYASYILFELHKINSQYGIKIYYRVKYGDKPILLRVPGCNEFCPIAQFEKLVKDVLPDANTKC